MAVVEAGEDERGARGGAGGLRGVLVSLPRAQLSGEHVRRLGQTPGFSV